MEHGLLSIGETAKLLGVSIDTLRIWDSKGILNSFRPTPTSNRYYLQEEIDRFLNAGRRQIKIDLIALAEGWVNSEIPTNLSKQFYCEKSDIFKARYERLTSELSAITEVKDIAPLISAIIGEMGNNSFDHNLGNWPDVAGVFFGYDIKERKIVLADRGRGVLKTLHNVIPALKTDEEALRIAFTKIITGRAPEGRGNGLKFVKEIVTKNPLRLIFKTGNAELLLKQHDAELDIHKSDFSFHGCMAVLYF